MVEPAAKRNEAIVKAAKAFNRLPDEQKTRANALKIFNFFNTNNTGASKDKLTDADQIDEYFKDVMGLSVMNTSISQDDFVDNIEDWALEMAKYKAPKPKPEPPKQPFAKVDQTKARVLANNLVKAMAPNGQTSAAGVAVAENGLAAAVGAGTATGAAAGAIVTSWSGGWGALIGAGVGAIGGAIHYLCSDTDKDRYNKAYELFGDGQDKINKNNIVEVMRYVNPEVLNRVIDTLDDGDDSTIRQTIAHAFDDRIAALKKAKCITPQDAENLSQMVTCLETNTDFKENLQGLWRTLAGVGVEDK